MADDKLIIEDAKIIFRNFSGQTSQMNPEGKRSFCVLLPTELGEKLKLDGWNVRWSEGRDKDDKPQGFMQVAVSFDNYPPSIVLVTNKSKTMLKEEDIGMLDWAEIKALDLIIRPYSWEVNGKRGIKGYLKSMYVTIEEDEFANKYADIPNGDTTDDNGAVSNT